MNGKGNGFSKGMKAFALGSTIAVQFAASVFLGMWVGRWLDERFGTAPWLMVVGLLAGLGAGTLGVYRTVSRTFSNSGSNSDKDPGRG